MRSMRGTFSSDEALRRRSDGGETYDSVMSASGSQGFAQMCVDWVFCLSDLGADLSGWHPRTDRALHAGYGARQPSAGYKCWASFAVLAHAATS